MKAKDIVTHKSGGGLMAIVRVFAAGERGGRENELAECVWLSRGLPRRGKFALDSLAPAPEPLLGEGITTRRYSW
jgi:uncharacterized protein YodC (DUF2158 family)